MKKILSAIIACAVVFTLFTGCSVEKGGKKTIMATLFPQYDFARTIAGDRFEVKLLLAPGTESHTYDPGASDMYAIANSALFLYTGDEMEPWAGTLISSLGEDCPEVVDCSQNVPLIKEDHDHEEEEHDHEHEADPHIWLDMDNAKIMAENICSGLCRIDPENAESYKENCQKLKNELDELDGEFEQLFSDSDTDTIVFGGRFSYIYFIERYGLDYVTAYKSCSASAEPSLADIAEVVDHINESGAKAIYYEELSEPKVARAIAQDTGIKALEFSTAHNVTAQQLESGVTFIDIMRQNIANLREGLC